MSKLDYKEAIIDVKNLKIQRREKLLHQALNFKVHQQDFLAIIGANGVGKTSLMAALLNLIPANVQDCSLYGQRISQYSTKSLAQQISFVPQLHNGDCLEMTVERWCEMARFPYHHFGFFQTPQDKREIQRAILLTGMEKYRDMPMNRLSGGERQKALIAGVVAQNTPIIFLDEPLNHLDLKHQEEILCLLKKLNNECNKTIVCVMHDMNQVIRHFKQVLGLGKEGILFQGNCDETMTESNLSRLYHHPIQRIQSKSSTNPMQNYPIFIAG